MMMYQVWDWLQLLQRMLQQEALLLSCLTSQTLAVVTAENLHEQKFLHVATITSPVQLGFETVDSSRTGLNCVFPLLKRATE